MNTKGTLNPQKPPRGRPPADAAQFPDPTEPEALPDLAELEAIGRAPQEQAVRDLEAFRDRLRAAHREVPAAITQIRALESLYLPELRRLAALPWPEYRARLGAETLVGSLRRKVDDLVAIFVGKSHHEFTVASVPDQLARLANQIERLGLDDRTRADEIVADCRRAPEWPAVLVKQMFEIRDLYQRLVEALRRRGGWAVVVLPASRGIEITTTTGAPRPAAHSVAETAFDPLA